ncbi:MAG TPA: hypothetical protein VLF91_01540 [Candidatus Saccharimonadales bacterium]|nr:hypothetical protein [Candidatus Saccharimonadales bacterium]
MQNRHELNQLQPFPEGERHQLSEREHQKVDTYLLSPEATQETFGLHGALVCQVHLSSNPADDAPDLFVLDRGTEPAARISSDAPDDRHSMLLEPEKRYVVLTGAYMRERAAAIAAARETTGQPTSLTRPAGDGWQGYNVSDYSPYFGSERLQEELGIHVPLERHQYAFMLDLSNRSVILTPGHLPEGISTMTGKVERPEIPEIDGARGVIPEIYRTFQVDEVAFRYLGPTKVSRRDAYLFQSQDSTGQKRMVLVYKSGSQGEWRASQGIARMGGEVLLKGASGGGERSSYTQDTQLHPNFKMVIDYLERYRDDPDLGRRLGVLAIGEAPDEMLADSIKQQVIDQNRELAKLQTTESALAIEEFESLLSYVPLGGKDIDALLLALQPGELTPKAMAAAAGIAPGGSPEAIYNAYFAKIGELNTLLVQQHMIPDFNQPPQRIVHGSHDIFGPTKTELYTHTVARRTYEWHMTKDEHGRAWISNIRLAYSPMTPYGTDAEMVNAGILVSKPLEYPQQATGLPDRLTPYLKGYVNLTRFLEMFEPIRRYKQFRVAEPNSDS